MKPYMLGTFSGICEEKGIDAVLVTGDRDAFQLAGKHTTILYTKRGISDTERITPDYLRDTYGLSPAQMIDLKGLMGDNSDNIPGVPGVGEKTALRLLHSYGTLEETLARADSSEKGKLRERLIEFADQARFSKKIATIVRDAPIERDFESLRLKDLSDGLPALQKYQLRQLSERLKDMKPAVEDSGLTFSEILHFGSLDELRAFLPAQQGACAIDLSDGISVAFENGKQAFVPGAEGLLAMFDLQDAVSCVRDILAGPCEKVVCGLKQLYALSDPLGIEWNGPVLDLALAAYLIDPQRKSFEGQALLESEGFAPDGAHTAAARFLQLAKRYSARMEQDHLTDLYRDIELPLSRSLRDMEQAGFATDPAVLEELGARFRADIERLKGEIHELAGEAFNLNSPKQLAAILFDKLHLSTDRTRSTSAEKLEQIELQHPIVPKILEYRKVFKLNSTYIEALLRLRAGDGRVHTVFDQTAAVTGRISSNEPNLQNIPVRTEMGKEIRAAFVAGEGCVLVDADYSQIELRVLAHMSGDPVMCETFRLGQDIHRRTASEVYGVPLEDVTGQMRSAAKAVNFGLVYGISEFGLARNLGVSRAQAAEFMKRYFARYPKVHAFMDACVARGRAEGFVTTLRGRRRYLKDLTSSNYNMRSFAERAAMNSPIQGTAADIIKIAMIRVDRALKEQHLKARLILQVHDELIVEAPLEEQDAVVALLRQAMEQAETLSVPLIVDITTGGTWYACKE